MRRINHKSGFTLLELMVAVVLLVTAMTMIVGTFNAVIKAWRRGGELLEGLHHGDFVLDQLVSGLRSAAFFDTAPEKYGFHLDDRSSGPYANDVISWVTSGTAFMPKDSPLGKGLHRIEVTVENNEAGDAAVAVRAYPHLAEEEDLDEADPWYISTEVKGLNCRVYDKEEEDWIDEWEFSNAVPRLVEITIYLDPLEEYGDPVELKRVVEIPMGSAEVKKGGSVTSSPEGNAQADKISGPQGQPPGQGGEGAEP